MVLPLSHSVRGLFLCARQAPSSLRSSSSSCTSTRRRARSATSATTRTCKAVHAAGGFAEIIVGATARARSTLNAAFLRLFCPSKDEATTPKNHTARAPGTHPSRALINSSSCFICGRGRKRSPWVIKLIQKQTGTLVSCAFREAFRISSEGGAPYVAYGFDSVRTPYDTRTGERTKHRTEPYGKLRHRTTKYDNVWHRKAPYQTPYATPYEDRTSTVSDVRSAPL